MSTITTTETTVDTNSTAAPEQVIDITPRAVQKIREQFEKHGMLGQGGLRLGIQGGGCSGLSYLFKFEPKPRKTDTIIDLGEVRVYVDPKSAVYLKGMTLDWKDSLVHSGFVFDNPNAKKSCGCGTSFAG